MHGKLREREVDAFFIKGFINSLVYIKINSPVICRIHPHTGYHIHTAGIQRMKGNKRGGISQNTIVGRQYITDNLLYLIIIFSIICLLYTSDAADE